jgi:hypothetical protein
MNPIRAPAPAIDRSWILQSVADGECAMPNPLRSADKYRKVAEEFSDRAKGASSAFLREYYQRVTDRYLSLADDELRSAEKRRIGRRAQRA